ncbi:hypothetical protein BUALT_Bualt15G0019000 [Buddleja alternifolia]|uniref:CRM domain-containing protein n=1 Tax=Buddleja alternifolia TaxID=168488 RepID=A0AAV6WIE3_9LAMI|nr:hypothetical protein BUALT_Bualt15G0019000 [Buddleja alternifolia]
MATVASSFPHLLLHRFILRRPTPSLIHAKQSCFRSLKTTPYYLTSSPFSSRTLFSSLTPCAAPEQLQNDAALLENELNESETETATITPAAAEGLKKSNVVVVKSPPPPILSVKEKKELASYAHSLGKKLKSQQVGKSGVTDTVVMALVETLEANELLELKIHNSCPGDFEDAVKQLEESTGSVVVCQIGRTVILYRPSVTKQKAEEKKKQAQRVFLKRQQMAQSRRPVSVPGEETREFGGGRRGRSRY